MSAATVEYSGARVLVLGASGFLGRWTARVLAQRGAEVTLCARDAGALERLRGPWDLRGRALIADLERPGEVRRCVREVRPAAVFNLAGYGVDRSERDEALAEALNARLPAELAAELPEARDSSWRGVPLVHAGSALEYGTLETHLREDEQEHPTTLYGRTKLSGTRGLLARARVNGLRAVVARLFTVYGPGEHPGRLLPSLRDAAARREDVPLSSGVQQRDFTYVEDVVDGLLRLGLLSAAALPGQEIVNLASGRLSSVRAFAEEAAGALGIAAGRLRFGALAGRTDDMQHLPVCVERLRGLLGWAPATSIRAGVQRAEALERRLLDAGPGGSPVC